MKRLVGIMVAAMALALCLGGVGCSQPTGNAENAITVSASGTAQIAPDQANIGIVVASHGATSEEASANAMRMANDVMARLKTAGADEAQMSAVQGEPEAVYGGIEEEQIMGGYYDWDGNWVETGPEISYIDRTSEVVGYDTSVTVMANHVAIGLVPTMLKESVAAGATAFKDFTYIISDRDAAYHAALTAAVDAAHAKAEALASASKVYVGQVVNMEELSDPATLVLTAPGDTSKLDAKDTATLTIDPAPLPITASVNVSYAIS